MSDEVLSGATATSTPTPAPEATPAAATSIPGAASAPTAAQPPEPLHEIKWNGQTQKVPLSKLVELAQQGYDYTKKSQGLSAREREWQGQLGSYQKAIGEIRTFLADRAKVKAYYDAMAAGDPAAGDPESLLTAQQAEALVQRQVTAQRQEMARELARMREEMRLETMAAGYGEKLDQTVNGLLQAHPELRTIPQIGRILKEEAAYRGPGSLAEAQSLLGEIAKQHAENVRSFFAEQQKSVAAGAAPLSRGIEPPGGGGAPPPAPGVQTPKNFNSPEFRAAVLADLQAAFKKDG